MADSNLKTLPKMPHKLSELHETHCQNIFQHRPTMCPKLNQKWLPNWFPNKHFKMNDVGPRFGTQNQSKIDYVFCCVFGHLKKLYRDDYELHNESKMEPILINFGNLATMRFCCYLLHFRTMLTRIIRCKIYEETDRNVSCLLFVINLLLDWFWTSILGPLVTLFSWFPC